MLLVHATVHVHMNEGTCYATPFFCMWTMYVMLMLILIHVHVNVINDLLYPGGCTHVTLVCTL